jgi:hypothetical protein
VKKPVSREAGEIPQARLPKKRTLTDGCDIVYFDIRYHFLAIFDIRTTDFDA